MKLLNDITFEIGQRLLEQSCFDQEDARWKEQEREIQLLRAEQARISRRINITYCEQRIRELFKKGVFNWDDEDMAEYNMLLPTLLRLNNIEIY